MTIDPNWNSPYEISVVIPVFQNEGSLERLFSRLDGVVLDLHSMNKKLEIVFVNDG